MDVYVVTVSDRHTDPQAYPFSDREQAIAVAREIADAAADDAREVAVAEWLFCVEYGTEGDAVWVVHRQMDDRDAWTR